MGSSAWASLGCELVAHRPAWSRPVESYCGCLGGTGAQRPVAVLALRGARWRGAVVSGEARLRCSPVGRTGGSCVMQKPARGRKYRVLIRHAFEQPLHARSEPSRIM